MKHKRIRFAYLLMAIATTSFAQHTSGSLSFNPERYTESSITLPTGQTVKYRAYEGVSFVENAVDPVYQTLNLYVPEAAYTQPASAVFLKTNIGGYRATKASKPSETDASGRALAEGYVVVIPGSRGNNSTVTQTDGSVYYTGTAPSGLVDLKAAIRYLRHNAAKIPGNMERIFIDGTSAGGAMASLVGVTGNHPEYDPYLKQLGAANERDDVFAAVCFCPITDLDHADMAYEWLYQRTNGKSRNLSPEQQAVSEELAAQYPGYLNGLGLKKPDGTALIEQNYLDYIKHFLIQSAQRARNEGCEIPEETGVKFNKGGRGTSEFVVDIDLDKYFAYVIAQRTLKNPPAFDAMGLLNNRASAENEVFGDPSGEAANFTDFSLRKSTGDAAARISAEMEKRVYLLNPMNFIGDEGCKTAPYWYIRHGALDRDTSFSVPINLYSKLINNGFKVDFRLPWNRNHSGDYDLDELFNWIACTLKQAGAGK